MTEEFYGTTLPDVELVIRDVSERTDPRTISGILTQNDDNSWNLEGTITSHYFGRTFCDWTLRQVEDLKTKRDYQVLLDSYTCVDSENFTFRFPVTITSLIGEFCNPVISSGHILLIHHNGPDISSYSSSI